MDCSSVDRDCSYHFRGARTFGGAADADYDCDCAIGVAFAVVRAAAAADIVVDGFAVAYSCSPQIWPASCATPSDMVSAIALIASLVQSLAADPMQSKYFACASQWQPTIGSLRQ